MAFYFNQIYTYSFRWPISNYRVQSRMDCFMNLNFNELEKRYQISVCILILSCTSTAYLYNVLSMLLIICACIGTTLLCKELKTIFDMTCYYVKC